MTSSNQFPINLGKQEEFLRVATMLRSASYDEETLCETFKLADIADVGSIQEAAVDAAHISDRLRMLIRLFLLMSPLPREAVGRVLGSESLDFLLSLGLLGSGEIDHDKVYAKVLLYPVSGFWIASDRYSNPDGSAFNAPADIVFPAIYRGTLRFLKLIPKSFAVDVLDLCGGTGIAALVLSHSSKRAVSSDITARATRFAQFNSALNNSANMEVVCGDLYAGVEGQTFDRIVAHPPYVPSLGSAAIWRDGGTTGELLVRRIIEGLPAHLRPNGLFCMLSIGLDTREGNFEERARAWLKDAESEFDMIFARDNEQTPQELLKKLSEQHGFGPSELRNLKEEFENIGMLNIPYGALFMRRRSRIATAKQWNVRTKLSDQTTGDDFEAAFALHDRITQPGFREQLTRAKLQLSPYLQVNVTHVVYKGTLLPADFVFETQKPFTKKARLDSWMVPLVTAFDGRRTPAEVFEDVKKTSDVPESFAMKDYIDLVTRMIEAGFLSLP
jgi:SAM-dependent methyltransferase